MAPHSNSRLVENNDINKNKIRQLHSNSEFAKCNSFNKNKVRLLTIGIALDIYIIYTLA